MGIKSVNIKVIHTGLTKAFSNAFEVLQKQGVNIKDLHWFNSESRKDSKERGFT